MVRWWRRMRVWQRVLLILFACEIPVAVAMLAGRLDPAWVIAPNSVLVIVNFVLTQREANRRARRGEDGGPPWR